MNNDFVNSTLDKSAKAFCKEIINVRKLVNDYQLQFGFDVSEYFNGLKEIKIYECKNTKYRFYYPLGIYGDSSFYEKLQTLDWYYMPWKWEHTTTMSMLEESNKILEVGSGGLGFIEKMNINGFNIKGLELNNQSILKGEKLNLRVFNETIEDHAINHFEEYDAVCSFQVLEHISDVHSFIKAQVDCLKKGGKLIIAVPNNDSFIKFSKGGLLNSPPHHMGLWNKRSLVSLEKIFNLKVDEIIYEPLQDYHYKWYIESSLQKNIYKSRLLKLIFSMLKLKNIYSRFVKRFKNQINGHTILVTYIKN
jgi:SAM-dependent methyltransferase